MHGKSLQLLCTVRHIRSTLPARAKQRRYIHSVDVASFPTLLSTTNDVKNRCEQLASAKDLRAFYPRLEERPSVRRLSPQAFKEQFDEIHVTQDNINVNVFGKHCSFANPNETVLTNPGRVRSVRKAGSKLLFLDLERGNGKMQALCNFKVVARSSASIDEFEAFAGIVRKGDWVGKYWPHYFGRLIQLAQR